jgi:hypothetical protein
MDFTNIGNDFNIYNMKYLKRFNESVDKSNIEEIKQTIKDILLPISDMGYEISVTDDVFPYICRQMDFNGELTGIIIRVVSYTDTPLKMNDEVTDEFIRMKEYLESSGFNSVESIYVREGSNYRFEEDFNEFIILEEVILRNLLFVAKVN